MIYDLVGDFVPALFLIGGLVASFRLARHMANRS